MTLWDAMVALYDRLGYYVEDVVSITMPGKEGIENIGRMMSSLRENPPMAFGDLKVTAIRDYRKDCIRDFVTQTERTTGLPSSDVLYFELEEEAWVCVRPSGTEPKIKLYCGARGRDEADAAARLAALKEALKSLA